MRYDLVIKRTLRDAQGILWANLPPASNLPDAQAVKSLRSLVRTPQGQQVLEGATTGPFVSCVRKPFPGAQGGRGQRLGSHATETGLHARVSRGIGTR